MVRSTIASMVVAAGLFIAPAAARAQGPIAARGDGPVVVDQVVAVVGNRPILASQVEEEIFSRQAQGMQLPSDSAGMMALRREVINAIIDEELLVQQALRDTLIQVTTDEIARGVNQQIRKVRSNFISEVDYASELRKAGFQTPEEYRRWLTDQQRRAALQNRLLDQLRADGRLKPVTPTDAEMRAFFEQHKGSLGDRPATVSFEQVVVVPEPSPEAKERARLQADSIVQELRKGADFAVAAKRFSEDPGSRERGGSLSWFRRGVMVPEFERVAFYLKPGVISNPVESPFGWHIIQVERVQPGEVQARHILLVPDIIQENIDSARALAERIHEAVRAGASIDSLQRLYHDPSAERQVADVPLDKVPEAYRPVLDGVESGTVVPLFTVKGQQGQDQYVVLKVTRKRAAGEIRFEDVRNQIRDRLGQQLAIRQYLDRLREATYVDVRI